MIFQKLSLALNYKITNNIDQSKKVVLKDIWDKHNSMSGYANTLLCKLYGECLYPNNERDKIDPRDTGEQLATYSSTIHPNPTNHSINIEVKG